ncbi:MAG: hypothetical protein ABIE70_07090 [bacterium]
MNGLTRGKQAMTEERISNIAQTSFLVGGAMYIGYSLVQSVLSVLTGFLHF